MQQVTPILGNESAIQYQGVKDATSGTGIAPIVGLMIGTFKRGRLDKPMTITNENIRSQLGYEPKNPSYIAVQDVLASGVPSVQVLRVKEEGGNAVGVITCAGATQEINFSTLDDYYNIKINGMLHETGSNLPAYIREYLEPVLGCNNDGFCDIWNRSYTDYQRIELIPTRGGLQTPVLHSESDNPTVHIDSVTGIITFCLSPKVLAET